MAVAISPEESGLFGSSSPLHRASSQPRFPMQQGGFRKSASTSRLQDTYRPIYSSHRPHPQAQAISPHSSPPSTPQTLATESTDVSFASTPASDVSDSDETINLDSIDFHDSLHFPQYNLDADPHNHRPHEDLEPPPSPPTGDSYTVSSNDLENSTVASSPEPVDVVPKGFDDIAVQQTPSHHVDYLSHNWREEDIWASWKYVTSNRADYANSERLENASWRTWMKSKNKLKTVTPETLNWLKDCDVTWLYGPLQRGSTGSPTAEVPSSTISKSPSFINKKPILKKRSMSEVMLQQSLSAASLLKQATAALQAQQNLAARRPALARASTDMPALPFAPISRQNSLAPSSDTSGVTSPSSERKHIHFNEQVEQCIAVDVKGDDEEGYDSFAGAYDDEYSDSDEGIVMKTVSRKKHRTKPRKSALKRCMSADTKTIASLPSTTLKYRDESPEPRETAMKHSYRSPLISPSSSQETLRPPKRAGFYMGSDSDSDGDSDRDEEEEGNSSQTVTPRVRSPSPRSSGGAPGRTGSKLRGSAESASCTLEEQPSGSGMRRSTSTSSLGGEGSGMRRTPSGMLMPIEEGEQSDNAGVFGRVIDTVNTARDIAHVIWNVGWRR